MKINSQNWESESNPEYREQYKQMISIHNVSLIEGYRKENVLGHYIPWWFVSKDTLVANERPLVEWPRWDLSKRSIYIYSWNIKECVLSLVVDLSTYIIKVPFISFDLKKVYLWFERMHSIERLPCISAFLIKINISFSENT